MQKGTIGVTTDNIFPVIKKFLYSDHDIFLREIVSNAVDATQKLKTLAQRGEIKGEPGDLTVRISVDKEAGTLTISDRGIGMTAEEIDKYINQIAFSGAGEFLEKYQNDAAAIIGHFGLGFYSAFMVSKQVDIITRSYKEGAQAVRWSCQGTPEFEIVEIEKADRGTDIVLHIDDENKDFLETYKINELLHKYCRFLAVPIAFGKKTEWKDGKQVETDEDEIVNDSNPLWKRKPSELTDEDYIKFYHELYPGGDDPLFWIHLNVDYPFNLTGVLYFPKIHNSIDLQRNKVQLYCNQVFVTDAVENIVPEFLTLLHGVIDSPDIPLNVSRSYLQSDQNVKKISTHITKKVSDRLNTQFKDDRNAFEEKWDDLKLFIHYGLLTQPDFYEKAKDYALLKDTEGKAYTYEEYRNLIVGAQTDKDQTLVYLYATNKEEQYSYIEAAKEKGYNVLVLDGQLDTPLINMFEQKFEKCRFSRVDSDTLDRLIPSENANDSVVLADDEKLRVTTLFRSQMPKNNDAQYFVETAALGAEGAPVMITQNEWSRRMKEMSQLQPGMSFYGQMPTSYNVVLNADHPLLKRVVTESADALDETLRPVLAELKGLNARHAAIEQMQKGKKDDEISQEEKDELAKCNTDIHTQEAERDRLIAEYGRDYELVHQLIDIALLQNGMLKGEALANFIKRSINFIK